MAAHLQVHVPRKAVLVQSGTVEHRAGAQQVGPRVHHAQGIQRVAGRDRVHVAHHIALHVHRQRERVAHGRRPQDGQHQIRPRTHAPAPQGQTKVLLVAVNAQLAGDVQQATQAHEGVHIDPHEAGRSGFAAQLQHVVHERPDIAQVCKEVADPRAHGPGHDLLVGRRHGLEHHGIDLFIEVGHAAVVRLQRVAGVRVGHRGAPGEQHGPQQQRQACRQAGNGPPVTSDAGAECKK